MPVTRKQKGTARNSRVADIISDLENLNVSIVRSLNEREENYFDDLAGRHDSQSCKKFSCA